MYLIIMPVNVLQGEDQEFPGTPRNLSYITIRSPGQQRRSRHQINEQSGKERWGRN